MTGIWTGEAYSRFAATLAETERLPRSVLDAYQDALLRRLVTFAYRESPFYRDRLKALFRHSEEPNLTAWREVPILARDDLQQQSERINPVRLPEEMGRVTVLRTSGTSSARLSFRTCDLARLAAECMMHRLYRWQGFDLGAPMASIRYYGSGRHGYPDGITEAHWSSPRRPAPHYTLDLRTPVENTIDWLSRRRPTYLLTFPSVAHDLAQHPQAEKVAQLGLQAIVGISEIVSGDTRVAVRQVIGCEIAQIYACAEMGCIALQSESDGHCSVCEETVYVEILDASGNPARPGETGRVVLTSLYNYATPFIRYEIGDYATFSDRPCPAGRSLQRLKRIAGRRRNALIAQDGSRRWEDTVLSEHFSELFPSHLFQIRQTHVDRIELDYVPNDAKARPNKQALVHHFTELLGGPVNLKLTSVEEIARSSGGKRERLVSAVALNEPCIHLQ